MLAGTMKLTTRMFSRNFRCLLYGFAFAGGSLLESAPVRLTDEAPVVVSKLGTGVILVDFGRVAFGNLRLIPPAGAKGKLRVHFGEASKGGRIDRTPPGSVRYAAVEVEIDGKSIVAAPLADARNTKPPAAVLAPPEWGVVLPFRWVEIEGWQGDFHAANAIRQAGYLTAWSDDAASFSSSDPTLDRIWELCRYSIKATTFAGIYVDGDRERIPYEADAYLNQISHYTTDNDLEMTRDSFDWLMKQPTWPSEWAPHMVFMAHADWMHTGDAKWLTPRYESLKTKLLMERVDRDGWVRSNKKQREWNDIVDWPKAERDGYEFREVNTVVNAFHLAALRKMADLARAVGKSNEADDYTARFESARTRFHTALFMEKKSAYRDGIGSDHASSHASLFPLAFGLVPEESAPAVAANLTKRGMTCSVYAAQYLLEGLLQNGADVAAMNLILAKNDRSWRHMLDSGTTITWEAWDQKYKPNQDWNHAWGAAPANLLPRFVLGVEPLAAGWETARIRPFPSGLTEAKGKIPTPRGPISIHWIKNSGFNLKLDLPPGMTALLDLPAASATSRVSVDGNDATTTRKGTRLFLTQPLSGSRVIVVK